MLKSTKCISCPLELQMESMSIDNTQLFVIQMNRYLITFLSLLVLLKSCASVVLQTGSSESTTPPPRKLISLIRNDRLQSMMQQLIIKEGELDRQIDFVKGELTRNQKRIRKAH